MKRFPTRRALLALLLSTAGGAQAQGFALEGAVIDSRSGQSLGVVTERGDINGLFRAQKAMTFGILRSAGISLEQLPPEVRARIERFQTTNVDAFRAFSQGLDLKDQGRYAEAKEFFRRAAELDPGFALASEQQRSMPDVTVGGSVQLRAVIVAAAGAAVDRGKASYVVDAARAAAAIQAGQTVVIVPGQAMEAVLPADRTYTVNPPGSGDQFAGQAVVGLAYTYVQNGTPIGLGTSTELRAGEFTASNGVLESVGPAANPQARRGASAVGNLDSTPLTDGSTAFWGSWLSAPGASAVVRVGNTNFSEANLSQVDYVYGDSTRQMPTSGSAVFRPSGGMLAGATGSIAVDFVSRSVELQNLGFSIGAMSFSGLSGRSTYEAQSASGSFRGSYTAGSCNGCGLVLASSQYFGNFIGRNADGLVFSTSLSTGLGIVPGVQLFKP
ncbi:tetratricopeptide repeat protein [Rubrivivax sp. A210]|uniref:tetratricopeptide repeat protein n=1 Tax=Rubrivivax sp. A210 TaxID=2772301 RepID=UPI0019196E81|nr:tetratricopeptide repeat protein [Rubrivivax sp. A210]